MILAKDRWAVRHKTVGSLGRLTCFTGLPGVGQVEPGWTHFPRSAGGKQVPQSRALVIEAVFQHFTLGTYSAPWHTMCTGQTPALLQERLKGRPWSTTEKGDRRLTEQIRREDMHVTPRALKAHSATVANVESPQVTGGYFPNAMFSR